MTPSMHLFKILLFAMGWALLVSVAASATGSQSGRPQLAATSCPNDRRFPVVPPIVAATRAPAQINGLWKTVVSAGGGRAAKGLYGTDGSVATPAIRSQGTVFEFTEHDDPDIGTITAAPSILKLSTAPLEERYFVLTAGGLNPVGSKNYLFLLSLDKAPQQPWLRDRNYFKIQLGSAGVVASGVATSGVATSGVATSGVLIYTGDLQGGLWRIDLSAGLHPSGLIAKQIFSAVDEQTRPQPITAPPVIVPAKEGGYLILFGTGKYLEPGDADPHNFQRNTFYAIHDDPVGHPNAKAASRATLARRTLQQASAHGKAAYIIRGDELTQDDAKKDGWYLDFEPSLLRGERSISPAIIADGQVFFNTLIPSGQPCNTDLGSRSYAIDIHTGKSKQEGQLTGYQPGHGLQGSPTLVLGQTDAGSADGGGSRMEIQHYQLINFASVAGPAESVTNGQTKLRVGRLSWRAIPNWQELKAQP